MIDNLRKLFKVLVPKRY